MTTNKKGSQDTLKSYLQFLIESLFIFTHISIPICKKGFSDHLH